MSENEVIPAFTGVLETSLYVDDVDRASEFYRALFGFQIMIEDHRFCALSVAGKQVLLLFRKGSSTTVTVVPGGDIPPHDGAGELHLAFSVPAAALSDWEARLAGLGIAIESRVSWPRGGHSVYFRDPDRNLVELITPGCWPIY
jgi:catechol 2,3-dioxygenase-like lactoylglutathione lyase family enzyme